MMAEFEDQLVESKRHVARPDVVKLTRPTVEKGLLVSSPHSGRFYPPELLSASVLDENGLRRSEDAFVDVLFGDAPHSGAILMTNQFGRSFVDVNRHPEELDRQLIAGFAPAIQIVESERVKAGLGVIPRTVGDGVSIYRGRISLQEAASRVGEVHRTWHAAMETELAALKEQFRAVLLIDCHSMPSMIGGKVNVDIVIGDRFGDSCAPIFSNEACRILRDLGFKVARNDPFAGGYAVQQYGKPSLQHHALQVEINRSLYMVEGAMTRRPSFVAVQEKMGQFVARMSDVFQGWSVQFK